MIGGPVEVDDQGWKPKPVVGAARCFSACDSTSVAAEVDHDPAGRAPVSRARRWALARPVAMASGAWLSIESKTRHAVGVDATEPKSSGWSRSVSPAARG